MLLLIVGCQEFALKEIEPDEVAENVILEVSPTAIDFGQAEPGTELSEVFTLSSWGTDAAVISTVTVVGSTAFSLFGMPSTLAPGESADVVVTWVAQSTDDAGSVRIESNASAPQLQVELNGQGLFPGIAVSPSSLSLTSYYGESTEGIVTVTSTGLADLVVSGTTLSGIHFSLPEDAGPSWTLEPGASRDLTVTYTPPGLEDLSTGELWLTHNAPSLQTVVPIVGQTPPPCYGLGEAWDRGVLTAQINSFGSIVLDNLDPDVPLCVDHWYVYLSDYSQDAAVGDGRFEVSDDYPYGSSEIAESDELSYPYGTSGEAWWCIELDQLTNPNEYYTFTGARVPDTLLEWILDRDQESVWAQQEVEPVIALGRTTHWLELAPGESAETGLRIWNIGAVTTTGLAYETVPPGFEASAFSTDPISTTTGSDGSVTYGFEFAHLSGYTVAPTGNHEFDWHGVTYTITRTGGCEARIYGTPAWAEWSDSNGSYVSTANPLALSCG